MTNWFLRCKCCGPKCALCCLAFNIWGLIQLSVMGILYYFHSVTLGEDLHHSLPDPKKPADLKKFYEHVDEAYLNVAYNCWMAAAMYAVILLIALHQFFANGCRVL